MNRLPTLACLTTQVFLSLTAAVQGQRDAFVASYRFFGKKAHITQNDLALEFARRYANEPRGKDALEHLLERTLVLEAAARENVTATATAIDHRIEKLSRLLESKGTSLESHLQSINITLPQIRATVELTILQDELVAKACGLASTSEVGPAQRQLWQKQVRRQAKIELDHRKLEHGVVAAWREKQLTLLDLGLILLQRADRSDELKFAQQIVLRHIFEHESERFGILITEKDRRREVEARRRSVERDPRFGNVPYEQFLQAHGTSMEELAQSPVITAMIQQQKIIQHLHPDSDLQKELDTNRAELDKRLGPQRQIRFILIRAIEEPNEFIKRDFDSALERANVAKKRMADGMTFADVARIFSDDPYTKIKGGDMGLTTQGSDKLPAAVLDQAFAQLPLVVSKPIRGPKGYYLVMVKLIKTPPTDAEMLRRMRNELKNEYLVEVLKTAQVEINDGGG